MATENDRIIIKKKKIKPEEKVESENPKTKSSKSRNFDRQLKIIAILFFAFAVLLFFALISYTIKDESNTQIRISDFWGLLTGDEVIHAKAARTKNWLGLFGAFLSNFLYNFTFGYIIIFLPFKHGL